jgi:asparagine synthase (glutamine-hydrolysing)
MCGIFAVFATSARSLPADVDRRVDMALHSIRHRGPDASGKHVDPSQRFAVGHVRLSVIDVSAASNQPFWSECGRKFVVFNGEIYNYLEIREELEMLGCRFRTNSDTEVLLQAIDRWGSEATRRFNGMWGFVYGDLDAERFVVSRDRWGVKPLYWTRAHGQLVICSEAKGIIAYLSEVPPPNKEAIGLFMKYGVGGEWPDSWFSGVERFPIASSAVGVFAGTAIEFGEPTRYWDYPLHRDKVSDSEFVKRLDVLLEDATRVRMRSDVPVGLSLSGGIDSGALAWMVGSRLGQRLSSFTAYYRPEHLSELPDARRIASMFGHTSVAVPEPDDFEGVLNDLSIGIHHLEAAHTSPAIVPYLRLCRRARRDVTVMLEGQGADELLAGYMFFGLFAGLDRLQRARPLDFLSDWICYAEVAGPQAFVGEIARLFSRRLYESQAARWSASRLLSPELLAALPDRLFAFRRGGRNLEDALRISHERGLTNLLQYGDALSMSVNLETRCPFLDFRLVELGFSCEPSIYFRSGFGKYPLRELLSGKLPEDICWRRRKQGFTNSTIPAMRKAIRHDSRMRALLALASQMGLITPAATDPETLLRLPPNICYRFASLAIWCGVFYSDHFDRQKVCV